ncbi:MAG: RnfABCDGE type electron transport complex subunit B [Candidatus Cloacimonetes bacterium]|nr:RnfABCDGE type electron transport complex subunit B [Candidatus Cloacimonadota bacterium]
MLEIIVFPTILFGSLALIFGIILGYASKVFQVKTDPKIEKINEVLPGVNCGACGYPGCAGYAEAIVQNDVEINLCPPGGKAVMNQIAEIMGKVASEKEKNIASILCSSGGYVNTNFKYDYHGIENCKAVNLLSGGPNQCNYGCVFQNDCIKACIYGAISVDKTGMRIIDIEKCIGCTACAKSCPRKLIKMIPISKTINVKCSSKDKAFEARKNCGNKTPCIGCGICAKNCPYKAIVLSNNLATIDYDLCTNCGLCAKQCPTKAIIDNKKRGKALIDFKKCIGCTICAKKCPANCISGELKRMHIVDQEKCIGCEICYEKCPKQAVVMNY